MLPLRDDVPSRRRPVVCWFLIALNLALFLYEVALPKGQLEAFLGTFAVVPAEVLPSLTTGQWTHWFPFVTSAFLHGGWLHLGGNLLFLHIFGDNVEDRMGPVRFLLFYLLCAVASALGQALAAPASHIPVLGASGAIAGVLGAYFLFFRQSRITTLVILGFFITTARIPAPVYLVVWFVLQAVSGVASLAMLQGGGGVAWWAHIGGFVAGLVLAPLLGGWPPRDPERRTPPRWQRFRKS